jgi:hypothetical protein
LGSTALILGAGASRSVSYAHLGEYPSPLDSDFFDLLQRLRPRKRDRHAVSFVLKESAALTSDLRRSMERAFYTLHLRAYLAEKLEADLDGVPSDEMVVEAFARSVQALLREAHGTNVCDRHVKLLRRFGPDDVVISFNYDLVPERALRSLVQNKKRHSAFGSCLYGFEDSPLTLICLWYSRCTGVLIGKSRIRHCLSEQSDGRTSTRFPAIWAIRALARRFQFSSLFGTSE